MLMRCTVVRAALGSPGADIGIEAAVGTPWRDVESKVLEAAGCEVGDAASAAGIRLEPDHAVGVHPLLDGCEIEASPASWTSQARVAHPSAAPVTLVAVSGPDSGRSLPLRPGRLVLGRGAGCDLILQDPDVSRRHCQIEVAPEGVLVRDLSSTNGTVVTQPRDPVRGHPASAWAPHGPEGGPMGVRVALGGHIAVGSSRLQIRLDPGHGSVAGHERGDGTVLHSAAPRSAIEESSRVFTVAPLLKTPTKRRIPWLAACLPVLLSIPIALWWGSPLFLLMGLAGPVIILGSVLGDRREARRVAAAAATEHAQAIADAQAAAERSAADILHGRLHLHPDPATVLDIARCRDPQLWARRASDRDAWVVRVAVADLGAPVRVDLNGGGTNGTAGGEDPVLPHAPVTVDLRRGVVVRGPTPWREAICNNIVGRLAVALGPDQLSVVVVPGTSQASRRWAWTRWLPHADNVRVTTQRLVDLERTLTHLLRVSPGDHPRADRLTVVVVDDVPDSALPRLAELAAAAADSSARVALLVSAAVDGPVPRDCLTRLQPAGEAGVGVEVCTPDASLVAIADQVGAWWVQRLARALAPVRPAAIPAAARLPDRVGLADLLRGVHTQARPLDTGPPTAAEVSRWWAAAEPADTGLSVPLAAGVGVAVVVDLVRDGPHALVAGTTGSGKSELLKSLVLGLACRYSPARLSFLLVDFKGGATLAECDRLPHSLGLLTDLDLHEARRVLTGLRAEIHRREQLLAAAGVADLAAYARRRPDQPLPRLVCVVDEFRVLAEHASDVLDALVHLAAVGRSLGLHLVLATQRPSGIVSADIRANTALRIALRVQDAADSRDVIDRPDASQLPRDCPGRAIISRDGVVEEVQTAHAGRLGVGTAPPRVWLLDSAGADHCGPAACDGRALGADDAARSSPLGGADVSVVALVEACREAVTSAGLPPARAWLPPLPARVTDVDVEQARPGARADAADVAVNHDDGSLGSPGGPGPCLPFALADLPDDQRRAALDWVPDRDGHLIILGGPRSGRTTAVAVLAAGALRQRVPAVVCTGRPGAAWPRGTTLVDWRDSDHLDDVLQVLCQRSSGSDQPWILLGIDDCDSLLQATADRPDVLDRLTTLSKDTLAGRIALVMVGGRGLGTTRMATGGRLRVLLRPADPFDATLIGAAQRDLPTTWPPGRGVITGYEFAGGTLPDGTRAVANRPPGSVVEIQVIAPAAGAADVVDEPSPPGLPTALPRRVCGADLAPSAWPTLTLGVVAGQARPPEAGADAGTGARWATAGVDVTARPGVVVCGPAGSGRTTALRLLALEAADCGASIVVLAPRSADWEDLRTAGVVTLVADLPGARSELVGTARRLLIIDDLDDCPPAVDELAAAIARSAGTGVAAGTSVGSTHAADISQDGERLTDLQPRDLGLAVAVTTAYLAGQFRGFAAEVRRHGSGLLLRPGRHDARDVYAASGPTQATTSPGRGLLISRGRAERIQVGHDRPTPSLPPTTVQRPHTPTLLPALTP